MNTSNNRRYHETEQKIKAAFLQLLDLGKSLEQIYVQDICNIAGISRPAFYTHYEDINDMFIKIEQEKAENIKEILMNEAVPSFQVFEKYFDYLKDNRSFYTAYFSSVDNAYVSWAMMDTYLKENKMYYEKSGLEEESIRYLMTFFSAGLKALALRWLKGGCKESSSEMVSLIHKAYSL